MVQTLRRTFWGMHFAEAFFRGTDFTEDFWGIHFAEDFWGIHFAEDFLVSKNGTQGSGEHSFSLHPTIPNYTYILPSHKHYPLPPPPLPPPPPHPPHTTGYPFPFDACFTSKCLLTYRALTGLAKQHQIQFLHCQRGLQFTLQAASHTQPFAPGNRR